MIVPNTIRFLLRRTARFIIKHGPRFVKSAAFRLPFSRFYKIQNLLLNGEEKICWRGINIEVNPGEICGYYPYFLNVYSDEETEKLIELCEKAHIFADVGANIGLTSLPLARACSQLKVFAFEPDRNIALKFCHNLHLNQNLSTKVRLIENAVCDIEENSFYEPSTDSHNNGIGKLSELKTPYEITTVRLDKFFENIGKYPDVVKIDVEGAEYRVLEGMRGLFGKGYPKSMLIEVHSHGQKDILTLNNKIKTILEDANFRLFQLKDRSWKELEKTQNWPGHFHILAVRNQDRHDQ